MSGLYLAHAAGSDRYKIGHTLKATAEARIEALNSEQPSHIIVQVDWVSMNRSAQKVRDWEEAIKWVFRSKAAHDNSDEWFCLRYEDIRVINMIFKGIRSEE